LPLAPLSQIGSVIRNPEVSGLVPHLLAAIADPNGATRPALDVLLETVFVNTIDAASLVSGAHHSFSLQCRSCRAQRRGFTVLLNMVPQITRRSMRCWKLLLFEAAASDLIFSLS
jgi:hypothetical protein